MRIIDVLEPNNFTYPLSKDIYDDKFIAYHGTSNSYTHSFEIEGWNLQEQPYDPKDFKLLMKIFDEIGFSTYSSEMSKHIALQEQLKLPSFTQIYWTARNYARNRGGEAVHHFILAAYDFLNLFNNTKLLSIHKQKLKNNFAENREMLRNLENKRLIETRKKSIILLKEKYEKLTENHFPQSVNSQRSKFLTTERDIAEYKDDLYGDAAEVSLLLQDKAIDYFKSDNFNKAIFYLGLITHYIVDCASFPHVIDYLLDDLFVTFCSRRERQNYILTNIEFGKIHNNYEDMISERTYREYNFNNNEFNFFRIQQDYVEREIINAKGSISSFQAVLNVAYNTFFDSNKWQNQGKFNASYMLNNYNRIMRNKWKNIDFGWQDYDELDLDIYNYLLKIQNILQIAIINISCALDNTISSI